MIVCLALSLAFAQEAPATPTDGAAPEIPLDVGYFPDRSGPPAVVPPTMLAMPDPVTVSLSDAVTLTVVTVPGVRKVSIDLLQQRGALDFEGHVTPAHLAAGWLQDVAGGDRDASEVAQFEDYWDADVWTAAGALKRARTSVTVPREDMAQAVPLLTDIFRSPVYPNRDIKQWKLAQSRSLLDEDPNSASAVASSLGRFGWYPADHPFGTRPDLDGIAHVKRGALLARHAEILRTAPIEVLVVGDVTVDDVQALLAPVVQGVGQPGEVSADPAFTAPLTSRILASDLPTAEQATIQLRMAAPLRDAPERVAFSAAAWAYGGHFQSRINRNLREERGITYGAHAGYSAGETSGLFYVGVDVPAEHVGEAIAQIEVELAKLAADGVTADELSADVLEKVGSWNRTLETASSAAPFYLGHILDQETLADDAARLEALQALTIDETTVAAAAWLGPVAARQWVVVGPRAVIEPQLEQVDVPVQWVAPQDAVLGHFE